jgi:hypothetical protein
MPLPPGLGGQTNHKSALTGRPDAWGRNNLDVAELQPGVGGNANPRSIYLCRKAPPPTFQSIA